MGTSGRNCSPSTRSREASMPRSLITVFILFLGSFSEAEKLVDGNGKERSGKLFFVSSSSTTSTVSTTTLCFTTDAGEAALGTCTKKRRRRSIEEANEQQTDEQIYSTPVRRQIEEEENNEPQLDSGVQDNSMDREGRFLLYWMTTTSTSTSTSFTSTTTLSNLICTPNGFTISLCG